MDLHQSRIPIASLTGTGLAVAETVTMIMKKMRRKKGTCTGWGYYYRAGMISDRSPAASNSRIAPFANSFRG